MAGEEVIWTSRALRQLKVFGLSRATALEAFRRPTKTGDLRRDLKKSIKILGDREIGFTFKKNDQGDFVILSCWLRQLSKK